MSSRLTTICSNGTKAPDGIKTGYVHASGFNLAASAVRDGRRLIAIVMGGSSARSRDEIMANLLDQGFADTGTPAGSRGTTLIAAPAPQPAGRSGISSAPAVVQKPGDTDAGNANCGWTGRR